MSRYRRFGRTALAAAALLAGLVTVPTAAAASTPAGDPWHDASYQPQPGNWRPYVLAPSGHTVAPVSASGQARSGSIGGDPRAALDGRHGTVRLTSTGGRATSPLLVLDFGQDVGGRISLHITGTSASSPILHACFSESLQFAAFTPTANNGEAAYAPGCDTANIWNGYPGLPYTYDSDSHALPTNGKKLPTTVTDSQPRGGFRYLTLFLDGPGSVDLNDVSLSFDAAPKQADPAAYRGWFLSSDNELNKIWYAGAYTVQLDTWMSDTAKSWPYPTGEPDQSDAQVPHADPRQEVIFDGAKRDRVVWQGDLAVEAPVTYLSTDDMSAVDNSLSSLAAQQLPDGYLPAESLVGQHNLDEIRTYGEYVTWFIDNHYEHWLYTGDLGYLRQWWPALTKAAAWLESVRAQDSQGLIAFGTVGSCGHETYVNALYARNLDQLATLATALGDHPSAATYAARSTALKTAINAQLWDPAVGAYRLSREIPNAYPQDANAAAVLTGVASPHQGAAALAYLRRTSWSTYGALTVSPSTPNSAISPFYEPLPSGFEASARLTVPDPSGISDATAEQLIRTFWGHQLAGDPGGTFWEKANLQGQPGIEQFTSLGHGWAAGPTIVLTTQVLGINPTGPGFSGYDVLPHPGGLTWSQGAVPTPKGTISASWRSTPSGFDLHTTAPSGTTGRLGVPTGGATVAVLLDGRPVWDGHRAVGGARADSADGYVTVSGVGAGAHDLTAIRLSPVPASANVVATASGAAVSVSVTGVAANRLTGTLRAQVPAGWSASPASAPVSLDSDGRPVTSSTTLTITAPAGSAAAPIPIVFTAPDGTTARTTVSVG